MLHRKWERRYGWAALFCLWLIVSFFVVSGLLLDQHTAAAAARGDVVRSTDPAVVTAVVMNVVMFAAGPAGLLFAVLWYWRRRQRLRAELAAEARAFNLARGASFRR